MSHGMAGLVGQAFFVAAATFAATSLIGYTTKKDMTGWGGFLSMLSIGAIIAMLVSFFFITDPGTSKMVSLGISAVVVLLFSVITAYETQGIKSMYIEGAKHGWARRVLEALVDLRRIHALRQLRDVVRAHLEHARHHEQRVSLISDFGSTKRPRFPGPFLLFRR